MSDHQEIDLSTPIRLKTSFLFPLQSRVARGEVVIGALWLLVPFVGWILHAWAIALAALLCSFLGLLAFGVGFLFTSVWFWQVAGFSFATAFTNKFRLREECEPRDAS
jgi:hypothetical protein